MKNTKVWQVEGIIVNNVSSILCSYQQASREDLYQQAWLICLELENKHKPELAKWSTYVCSQLPGRLKRYASKNYTNCMVDYEQEQEELTFPGADEILAFTNEMESMTNDASLIVEIILTDPTKFIRKQGESLSVTKIRSGIRKQLRKKGWSWPRIQRAFNEIKRALA
jgi:hypothetical protein